jgi:hypothetical protein
VQRMGVLVVRQVRMPADDSHANIKTKGASWRNSEAST